MTAYRPGGEIRVLEFEDERAEAEAIASEIAGLTGQGVRPEDIAVLSPTAQRLSTVAEALAAAGLPAAVWFGPSTTPEDLQELSTCLTVIRRTLNEGEADRLANLVGAPTDSSREVPEILAAGTEAAAVGALKELREAAFAGAGPVLIVDHARTALASVSPDRGAVLDELRVVVAGWTAEDPDFSLDQLLTEIALGNNGGASRPRAECESRRSTGQRASNGLTSIWSAWRRKHFRDTTRK
jgi:hypothetical protein